MRLITFQDKSCLSALDKGEWYSTRDYRVKLVDMDYFNEEDERYPIYTFASFYHTNSECFGLLQFYGLLTKLAGYMRFDLEQRVMVELEVPEDFILNMKDSGVWFETRCSEDDPDMEMRRRDSRSRELYYVKRDMTQGEFYTSDYLKVVRNNRNKEYEAVIPCIRKEHIAAIREFRVPGGNYDTTKCMTIYANDKLYPLWTGTVYLQGSGYPKFDCKEDADILLQIEAIRKGGSIPFEECIAQDKYGAKRVPKYFTLNETLACCNRDVREKVWSFIKEFNISKDDFDKITLSGEILE